jgi:hypothetical protein
MCHIWYSSDWTKHHTNWHIAWFDVTQKSDQTGCKSVKIAKGSLIQFTLLAGLTLHSGQL